MEYKYGANLPEVGSNCLALHGDDMKWYEVEVLKHRVNEAGISVAAVMRLDTFKIFWAGDFKPTPTERELLIDIILSTGNLSGGMLADAILTAGFTNTKGEIN